MADANDQEKPLTKTQVLPIAVDEALSTELRRRHHGFHKRTVCCGIVTSVFLIIAVVMLVLGFTVFHIKNPKINIKSLTITGLNLTDLLSGNANLTVVADVSIKNTNSASFKFHKSNSTLLYHGTVVGVADIPAGIAKARRTTRLNVTVAVMVAEIAENPQFGADLTARTLPVESYTKIIGKVKILNIAKRKVTVTMNCSIDVNLTSQEIVNQNCKKHVII